MDINSPIRIGVLVSGGGTNLQALIDSQREKILRTGEVSLVLSSSRNAYALIRAQEAGVPSIVAEGSSREDIILQAVREHNIKLLVLAGYIKILSEDFLEQVGIPVINIHPSLLPKYGGKGYYGLRVHEAVLANQESYSGATVHYVDATPDGGEIIAQEQVEVYPDDTPESLQKRIMENVEWKLLPQVIEELAKKIRDEESL